MLRKKRIETNHSHRIYSLIKCENAKTIQIIMANFNNLQGKRDERKTFFD
jgi:hypothetical protein